MKILQDFYQIYKTTTDTKTKNKFIENLERWKNYYKKYPNSEKNPYPDRLQEIIDDMGKTGK
ncbi:MAG: hypothetical protein LBF04_06825 [Prevotellaceae bacterium]|jgi:hypothetical protein|nr:hypothetical protein [Prevotellaceae bacterium]